MQNKQAILSPSATYHVYNHANGSEKIFRSQENYQYFLERYQAFISPVADTFCYCLMPNHFHFLLRIKSESELEAVFRDSGRDGKDLQGYSDKDLQGFKNLEGLRSGNLEGLRSGNLEGLRSGNLEGLCSGNLEGQRSGNLEGLRSGNPEGLRSGNPEGLRADKDSVTLETLISRRFSNFFNAYAKAFNKAYARKGSLFMHTFKRKQITDTDYLRNLVYYIHQNPVEAGLSPDVGSYPYSSYAAIVKNEQRFLMISELIDWFDDTENFIHFHKINRT